MSDNLREAPVGQLLRLAFGPSIMPYPEERPDFVVPDAYLSPEKQAERRRATRTTSQMTGASMSSASTPREVQSGIEKETSPAPLGHDALAQVPTQKDEEAPRPDSDDVSRSLSKIVTRPNMSHVSSRADLEQAYTNAIRQETLKQEASRPIQPQRTADGIVLVDWYSTTDSANPQNWTSNYKLWVVTQIYLYTLAVYIGSAIYTPSEPFIIEQFGTTPQIASLGLSLYVLGYGTGPLVFSPLSEIPSIGRNIPYLITFFIFVILTIPAAITNSLPGFLVLRFLLGWFGSPALATGGASLGDVYSLLYLPYALLGWAAFATAGPALGPLLSGFALPSLGWHFSIWQMLIMSAPVLVILMFCLPETSAQTILLRRAQRLRKLTGNNMLKAQSEIDQANLKVKEVVIANLWRPLQINLLDPSVAFTSAYIGLIYGIFYSFFESFPFVYSTGIPRPNTPTHGYGMNAGEEGLIFLSISVGVVFAIIAYVWYLRQFAEPEMRRVGFPVPERRLIPALFASFLAPIGLFIFGWTGFNSPQIHWIVPTIGITIFTAGVFIVFQCVFIYIPLSYPQYAASLFAGNDFFRSSLAVGAIHFARPLFINLGIGPGTSLLAGLSVGGVIGIFVLWHFGAKLRARSKFAVA